MSTSAETDALKAILAGDPGNGAPADLGLPPIPTTARPLRDLATAALDALDAANEPPALFVRSGRLARIRVDEADRALIETLGESELRGRLARVASFRRAGRKGDVDVPPPMEVVRDVLALGEWDFPPLAGLIETPVLRPDGSILGEAGYDKATRLIYRPRTGLSVPAIPDDPSAGDVAVATAMLQEAICDFPFADEASRAGALALMLTPIVRPAIEGNVPLAVLDATKAGTGKGLLGGLASLVATGTAGAVLPAPRREDEMQKTLFSALLAGSSFVLLDEVDELSSPALASTLTLGIFEGRVLGRTELLRLPQRATWAAAGNNVQLKGDLARRCYWIRLDAKTARPWQRKGFRHDDLLGWAAARRGDLLAALLTVSRAWWSQGKPAADVPVMGNFTEWAEVIGGILQSAGIEGFLGNLDQMYEAADTDAIAWQAFLAAWHQRHGEEPVTVATLAEQCGPRGPLHEALPDDLAEALGKSSASFKAKLGRALGKRAGTRFGDQGERVERAGQDTRSTAFSWRVAVDQPLAGVQGLQGSGNRRPARGHARPHARGGPSTPATPATPAAATEAEEAEVERITVKLGGAS